MTKETLDFVTPLSAEKLQNFFGVFLQFQIGVDSYDGTTYPPLEKVPRRYAIVRRNEWMVCESDVVISGVLHNWGGAARTLEFAQRKKKVVLQFPAQAEEK